MAVEYVVRDDEGGGQIIKSSKRLTDYRGGSVRIGDVTKKFLSIGHGICVKNQDLQ